MQLERTTLRLDKDLKKAAQMQALDEGTTLQAIHNRALEEFLGKKTQKKARKIVFHTHDMGEHLDNLTRDDFYPGPKL